VSTTSPPNPSHRLVAAPGQSSTGVPSSGPHSAHPRRLPSGRGVRPIRAGSTTPLFTVPSFLPATSPPNGVYGASGSFLPNRYHSSGHVRLDAPTGFRLLRSSS
jgi:hypothetical protein